VVAGAKARRAESDAWRAAEVTFTRIHKSFGSAIAVRELDLAIRAGNSSPAGPLRLRQDDQPADAGGARVPDQRQHQHRRPRVNDVAPGKRDVAMVFQSYALYPHMTVGENIAYR
jgi:multiple sugar transport system ATP-binding protein